MSRAVESIDRLPNPATFASVEQVVKDHAREQVSRMHRGVKFPTIKELGLKTDTLSNILLNEGPDDIFPHLPSPNSKLMPVKPSQPSIHELQTWFEMPSVRPNAGPYDQDTDRNDSTERLFHIEDDPSRPDNAFYVAQSITDLPPRWKTIIEEVASETMASGEKKPLRERLKTTFNSVISNIDERFQPTLMPGVGARAILEMPEALTDEQIRILLLDPNKKFVSLFLTLCLTMQNPEAPILRPVERIGPQMPPNGPVVETDAAQQRIHLSDLVAKAQAANPTVDKEIGTSPKAEKNGAEALPEPQSEKEEMQQLIAKELKKAEILTPEVLAYTWATVQHETASSWRAVREGYWLDEKRGFPEGTTGRREARVRGYGGGEDYYGRGLIQVTHDTGYRWVGDIIGMDLVNNPDKLLNKHISVAALTAWVKYREDGWGYTMVDYLNDGDFIGARSPVNGTDKAVVIAAIARNYLEEAREMVTILG